MFFNSKIRNSQDKTGRSRMGLLCVLVGVGLMVFGTTFAQAGDAVSAKLSTASQPVASVRHADNKLSTSEKIQQRLTYRYGNPAVERFARTVSTNNAVALYDETTRQDRTGSPIPRRD